MTPLDTPTFARPRVRDLPPVSRDGWLALDPTYVGWSSTALCPRRTLGTGETEAEARNCAIRNLVAEGRPSDEIERVYILKMHLLELPLPGEDQGIHIASIRETNRASAARMSPSLAGATLPHRERQILKGSRMLVEAPPCGASLRCGRSRRSSMRPIAASSGPSGGSKSAGPRRSCPSRGILASA